MRVVDVDGVGDALGGIERTTAEHHGQRSADIGVRVVVGVVRDDERTVDVSAEQVAAGLVERRLALDEHRQRVLGVGERKTHALHDRGEERVVEHVCRRLGHHEGDRLRAPARERARGAVRHVVERLDGLTHGGRDLGADLG